jgi:hypothetical protein
MRSNHAMRTPKASGVVHLVLVRSLRALLLVLPLALASVCAAQQPKAQPLKGKELAEFLGPVSPKAFHWSKYTMIDFELYNGEPQSPLAGHVGFYVGGWPDFKVPAGSKQVRGRLGRYPVTWYRAIDKSGHVSQDALIQLDNYWKIDLRVSANRQGELDQIIATISRLPVFTNKPKPVVSVNNIFTHPW